MSPENVLKDKLNDTKLLKLPISARMLPLTWQCAALKYWMERDRFPTEGGITPCRGLSEIAKSIKDLQFENEVMKFSGEEESSSVKLLLKRWSI